MRLSQVLFISILVGVLAFDIGHAVTVNTSTPVSELRGKEISIEFTLVSTGVNQETKTPLGTSRVNIGESVDIGTLEQSSDRPAQLRVDGPMGVFYRTVRRRELQNETIDLTVHPTGPNERLTVQEHSMLVQPFPNRLMIREIVVFNNQNNHLVGGVDSPITLNLPEGVGNFNPGPGFGGSSDYEISGDELSYHVKLAPGRTIIGFFYLIRTESDNYTLSRTLNRKTSQFLLNSMSNKKVNLKVEGLRKTSDEKAGGPPSKGATQYVGENLDAGVTVSMTWQGLSEMEMPKGMPGQTQRGEQAAPNTSRNEESTREGSSQSRPNVFSSVSWPVFIGIGISFFVFAGSYGYVQFHLKEKQSGVDTDFLVEEIARLDQEYEDGAIEEPFYNRTRRRWKNKMKTTEDEPGQET